MENKPFWSLYNTKSVLGYTLLCDRCGKSVKIANVWLHLAALVGRALGGAFRCSDCVKKSEK